MNLPTPRQIEVHEFLRIQITIHHNTPTVREIASHFGFKCPKSALKILIALEKKGMIRRPLNAHRNIELVTHAQAV